MQPRLLLFVSVLVGSRPARADQGAVALELSSCPDLPPERVKRVLAVELRAQVVDGALAPAGSRLVVVSCAGGRAALRAEDSVSGARVERTLDLAATAAVARPRLVALAAAELMGALAGQRPPAIQSPASAPGTVTVTAPAVARPGPARWSLLGQGHARARAGTGLGLGAGVRLAGGFTRLVLQAEILASRAWSAGSTGRVQVDEFEAGGAALARTPLGAWSVAGGLGLRLGAARLRGHPADAVALDGRVLTAPTGGVLLTAVIAAPPVGQVRCVLALEAGRVLLPVRGQAGVGPEAPVAAAIDGYWMGASLGVGVDLP